MDRDTGETLAELREALAEQQRQVERLQALLDSGSTALALFDGELLVLAANKRWSELIGSQQHWHDLFSQAPAAWDGAAKLALAGEVIVGGKDAFVTADNTARTISWRVGPWSHASSSNGGIVAQLVEVSQADVDLDESIYEREQRLNAVLNTAADSIITIDRFGVIGSANAATERMFGFSQEELLGQNVSLLMPSPYCDEHDDYIRRYLETGEARIIGIGREVTGRRKDGTVFPMHLAVSEVDHLQLFTGIIRDLTDLHRSHEKLLQAERLAAIGEMVTGLAHESRNALQRTKACLEMLELEVEDRPDALDLVQRIQGAQNHVHQLYEEVRSYAAPLVLKPNLLNLEEIWREAWSNLSDQHNLHIRFRVVQLTDDLSCHGDGHSLVQVFRNIFENAIMACGSKGEVTLTIADATTDKPAVEVRVADSGPGLSQEQMARMFEPFYTTKTSGTGLGMAIVRRIIEAHDGEISAGNRDSRLLNSGAEITIVLPRTRTRAV